MNINTAINPFNIVYKLADDSTSSFPVRVPTNVLPSNDGTLKMAPNTNFGQTSDNNVHFVFFGTGGNNATFQAQIVFWTKIMGLNGQYTPSVDLWIPEVVCSVDGVLGTSLGVDGTSIDSTHYFADTLTVTSGASNYPNAAIVSPANNTIAGLTITMTGPQIIEVLLKTSATINAAYKTF